MLFLGVEAKGRKPPARMSESVSASEQNGIICCSYATMYPTADSSCNTSIMSACDRKVAREGEIIRLAESHSCRSTSVSNTDAGVESN